MDTLLNIVTFINGNILQPVIMVLILFAGILLTIKTRFLQIRKFGYSFEMTLGKTVKSVIKKDKTDKKKISPFAAFSAAVAGTVGTGNIVGVATAIMLGGPGAIFWMWFSAFFGMVTNYSENILGIYFRSKDKNGEYKGGAMYYIVHGLGKNFKWLAMIFAVCAVLASIGFNFVQSNSITTTIAQAFSSNGTIPWWILLIIGILLAGIAALVIIGGIKRISTVTSYLVPFMAVAYMILALVIIFMNAGRIPTAFGSIFTQAFSLEGITGGIMGATITKGLRYGIARGIFSNEAGLGSSVMAHSSADVIEPVQQGLWGIFEVFLDTFIICTLTALVMLTSGAYESFLSGDLVSGVQMGLYAFKNSFGITGQVVFTIILPLFAFTTLISWSYYGEKAIEYVFGFKSKLYFRIGYVILIVVGSCVSADLVWELADTFNVLMAIPNLFALVVLSTLVASITKNYFDRKKGVNLTPMLSFYKDTNKELALKISVESDNAQTQIDETIENDEDAKN